MKAKIRSITFREYDPISSLLNKENMIAALFECIEDNDFAGFAEITLAYVEAIESAKQSNNKADQLNPALELEALFQEARLVAKK